jgi:PAS domain S-box-containing protein
MIHQPNVDNVLNVLSLEDSIADFEIICRQLIEAGYKLNVSRVENEKEFTASLRNNTWDIVLADFKLPGFDAFKALKIHNQICPDIPFICVSGLVGEETAIELIKQGAVDYVLKDRLIRLPIAIQQALENAKEKEKTKQLTIELRNSEQIFNCFMEHSPIYVFFKDENIRTIRLSKNYETMLGRPLAELLGKNMDELFPSELASKIVADDKLILNEGKIITVEEELNGRIYTTIKFPISIEGKPKYLSGYTIDITELKNNEKLLNAKIEEMSNFQHLTVGRELKMIELKKEINELLKELGRNEKYKIVK